MEEKWYKKGISVRRIVKIVLIFILFLMLANVFLEIFAPPIVSDVILRYDKETKNYIVVLVRSGFYSNVDCFVSSDFKEAVKTLMLLRFVFLVGGGNLERYQIPSSNSEKKILV